MTPEHRQIHNMKRQHQHQQGQNDDDEVFDDDEDQHYDQQQQEEEELQLRLQHEYEYNFYRRFIIFIVILFVFWVVVLLLDEHHDYSLMIAALVVFGLWFVYIFTCICCNICYLCQNSGGNDGLHRRRRGGGGMEQSILTSNVYFDDSGDEDADDEDENDDNSFSYPMKDTLQRIQEASLLQTIRPGKGPTNGTYLGVFSAVYFNKTLRTEGKFELEFIPTKEATTEDLSESNSSSKYNGWIIQGYSYFGERKRPIQNGFINPKGHMYWETNATSHRGKLNFDTSCMFDGEFSANLDTAINDDDRFPTHLKMTTTTTDGSSNSSKQPMGRIVRFELSKAQFYTSHLTGTSIISPTALLAEHKKKKSQLQNDNDIHNEMEMVTFSSSPEEELRQQQQQQLTPQPDLLV